VTKGRLVLMVDDLTIAILLGIYLVVWLIWEVRQ